MTEPSGAGVGPDGLARCAWAVGVPPDYTAYHDEEWGRPVHGDRDLFEKLCLEAFQSGLSWLTILRKREGFRAAFAGFDPAAVARFDEADVARLLADPGIVRNRAKIEATINNARALADGKLALAETIWRYADPKAPAPLTTADVPASTPASAQLAKDLKKAGFRFVGPTTVYAMMQACGLVNDHLAACHHREPST